MTGTVAFAVAIGTKATTLSLYVASPTVPMRISVVQETVQPMVTMAPFAQASPGAIEFLSTAVGQQSVTVDFPGYQDYAKYAQPPWAVSNCLMAANTPSNYPAPLAGPVATPPPNATPPPGPTPPPAPTPTPAPLPPGGGGGGGGCKGPCINKAIVPAARELPVAAILAFQPFGSGSQVTVATVAPPAPLPAVNTLVLAFAPATPGVCTVQVAPAPNVTPAPIATAPAVAVRVDGPLSLDPTTLVTSTSVTVPAPAPSSQPQTVIVYAYKPYNQQGFPFKVDGTNCQGIVAVNKGLEMTDNQDAYGGIWASIYLTWQNSGRCKVLASDAVPGDPTLVINVDAPPVGVQTPPPTQSPTPSPSCPAGEALSSRGVCVPCQWKKVPNCNPLSPNLWTNVNACTDPDMWSFAYVCPSGTVLGDLMSMPVLAWNDGNRRIYRQ